MLLRFAPRLPFSLPLLRHFATARTRRRIPKQTKDVAEYVEGSTAIQNVLEGKDTAYTVVPESNTGRRPASFEDEYLDAGQVITPEFLKSTEQAVDMLFDELLSQPPDAESKSKDRREELMLLPHEPDEFFLDRPKTIANYVMLLRVHIAKGLVNEGFRVYDKAVQEGNLTPCLTTYSLLISLCGSAVKHAGKTVVASPSRFAKEATKALELFTELRESGLVPDNYVYGSMIGTLTKLSHLDQAFKVLEMVKYQGLQPDRKMYTSLIVGCYNLELYDRAFEMFMEMRINGQEPDVTTYNMMMRIEAKKNAPEGALGYMTQLEHFGHTPDLQSYNLCIYSCANRPDYHEKAFELYDVAMSKGYRPTPTMLNSLLFVTSKMGDIETAKLLFDQFDSYKLQREPHTYATMLRTFANKIHQDFYVKHDGTKLKRSELVEMSEAYFDQFLASGEAPTRKILNAMLAVYTKGKQMQKAEEFRNVVFAKNGMQLDFYSYLHLIAMYHRIKALDKCYETFVEMKSVGLKPDYDIYMLVLRTCKFKKSDFLGVKVLKEMCDNGIVADEDVAYPFKEIVESLPDYKAPPSLVPERGVAVNEGLGLNEDRRIEQAKRQQQLMLQAPESLSLLERHRKSRFNDYNPNSFHPSNPEFVRNFVNRKIKNKSMHLTKPPLWPRAKNYQEGLIGDADPKAKLVGEKLIDHNMKEIRGMYIAAGGEKIDREPVPTKVKVKKTREPPKIQE